jgi:hypothetical protein
MAAAAHQSYVMTTRGIELYDDYLVQLVAALGLIASVTSGNVQDE